MRGGMVAIGGDAFFVCLGARPSFEMQRSSSSPLISLYLLLVVFLLPFVLSLLLFVIASSRNESINGGWGGTRHAITKPQIAAKFY